MKISRPLYTREKEIAIIHMQDLLKSNARTYIVLDNSLPTAGGIPEVFRVSLTEATRH